MAKTVHNNLVAFPRGYGNRVVKNGVLFLGFQNHQSNKIKKIIYQKNSTIL